MPERFEGCKGGYTIEDDWVIQGGGVTDKCRWLLCFSASVDSLFCRFRKAISVGAF
jgi:hypothetical protein